MKKLGLFFLLMFISFIPSVCAIDSKYDKVSDTNLKIYDYGNYLNRSQKEELKKKIDYYISKYKIDIVVVTKKNYNYDNMRYYAEDFYDYNGFGTDDVKSGIILFYNEDSEGPCIWVSTTGKAILYFDDIRLSKMKSNMSSVKSSGAYAIINSFIIDTKNYMFEGVPKSNKYAYIDKNGNYKIDYDKLKENEIGNNKSVNNISKSHAFISVLGYGIFISLIYSLYSLHKAKKKNITIKKEIDANIYLIKDSVRIHNVVDKLISSYTSKTRIEQVSSSRRHSSSRSYSGGSSTWSGSSGTTHGGSGGRL